MPIDTGFLNPDGTDVSAKLVEKSYLIDRYPELADTFKQAGLWMWGNNTQGTLGDGTSSNKSSPVQTVASGTNWKQVSGFYLHTAAIKTDGTLWLWGDNQYGQLGDNTITHRSSPVQTVAGGTNWKQVGVGSQHTAAIKTDGTLWTWGYNGIGQLGNNNSMTNYSSPIQTVSGGTNWKQVSAGGNMTGAIKTDGTLWVWGYNSNGNLGDGGIVSKSSPVQTVAGGTNWKQFSCGGLSSAAIKTDGTLWLWGYNFEGQLGTNDTTPRSSPVQTVAGGTNWKQVSSSSYFYFTSAAIKTDGTLWTWGSNSFGLLGDNTTVNKSSPVQTVAGGTNWKKVSVAPYISSAIKTDGTLWTWGYNNQGGLGTNNTTNRSSPVQTVAAGTNWKDLNAGYGCVVAIRDDSADPI